MPPAEARRCAAGCGWTPVGASGSTPAGRPMASVRGPASAEIASQKAMGFRGMHRRPGRLPCGAATLAALLGLVVSSPGAIAQTSPVLVWSSLDSGGATFAEMGGWRVSATVGQVGAGALTSGSLTLAGGFWGGGNVCGDGIVTGWEQCDDANLIDTDTCSSACTLGKCGDSVVQDPEACDDGNH